MITTRAFGKKLKNLDFPRERVLASGHYLIAHFRTGLGRNGLFYTSNSATHGPSPGRIYVKATACGGSSRLKRFSCVSEYAVPPPDAGGYGLSPALPSS